MNSSINNNVNLGGKQTISGVKSFLQNICRKLSVAFDSTPSSTINSGYTIKDVNNNMVASFQGIKYATGTNRAQMEIIGNSGTSRAMYVQETSDGGVTYSYGQQAGSSWVMIPRGVNNYLLFCWGGATLATGDTVTFPKAYSNPPSVQITMNSSTAYGFPAYLQSVTTTNFKARRNDSNDVPCLWFSIGTVQV